MTIVDWMLDADPSIRWRVMPFFEGEVEPCINGRAVAIGAYFDQHVQGNVHRLLTEQMAWYQEPSGA